MLDFTGFPAYVNVLILVGSAAVITWVGVILAGLADRLADRTGMGEAVTGALLLGASTSLSGIVTSITTAVDGSAQLSISNAVGGITAQTAFLAVADFSHRRVNLEHAAASAVNIVQGILLIALLSMPLLVMQMPPWTFWGVHPVSLLMLGSYGLGMKVVANVRHQPMWRPRRTPETKEDIPEASAQRENLLRLSLKFTFFALALAVSGYLVARSGSAVSRQTGLSQTVVGAYLMAVSTSLPELITSVAAVRRGALTLAIGDILGGNAFDTLFMAFADMAYRDGSIYHAVGENQRLLMLLGILMTAIMVMGLLGREKRGIANIGLESFLILVLYAASSLYVFLLG